MKKERTLKIITIVLILSISFSECAPLLIEHLNKEKDGTNQKLRENNPFEIGSNYDFTGNLNEPVVVTADNIVINGNGYAVIGPGTGYGFDLTGRNNVTIKNVIVTGWTNGFYLFSSSYNTFTNNTANNNYRGFFPFYSSNNTFTGNAANNNYIGFMILCSSNITCAGNNAANNVVGLSLSFGSNNTLMGNTANNNKVDFSFSSCSYNIFTGNTAETTTEINVFGFDLYNCSYSTFTSNTAKNTHWGFMLFEYCLYNTFTGNNATNTAYGFNLWGCSNNIFTSNTATNNRFSSFALESSSSNNILLDNIALNCSIEGSAYYWSSDSSNNDFTGSIWANYLRMKVTDILGLPIPGAEINVETDGTQVYATSFFGGLNKPTDLNGLTSWITVIYKTGTGIDQMTGNITTVTVALGDFTFFDNPRTVDMLTSHMETFIASEVYEMKEYVIWEIDQLIEKVQESPNESWNRRNNKRTMIQKLYELRFLVLCDDFENAYDKLLHDIKPKLTGLKSNENEEPWGNGVFKNPWVISEQLKEEFRLDCNEILSHIILMM